MLMQRLFAGPDTSVRSPIDPRVVLTIRWLAITGQLMALIFTYFVLGFDLPLIPALFIIGLSVLMNLWQNRQAKDDSGLVEQNLLALIFDILQLAALLFLTGGLLNPFSVLLLAPVVVSATMLRRRATLVLILTVAASVSVLALYNHPLPWDQDKVDLPGLYVAGLWMSLVLSTIFIGGYVWWVASAARSLSEALSQAQLAVAEEQQAVALGSLATAAAHKLGSPLNTITVISHELSREITEDDPIYEDIQLLRAEAERCRVILGSLEDYKSQSNPDFEPELPINVLIEDLLHERFDAGHADVIVTHDADTMDEVPVATRRAEFIQAIEDILQNAHQFARSQIVVHIEWSSEDIHISINDDGNGFKPSILSRAGQPWNSSREGEDGHRGLGMFIAQTLIRSIGGSVVFGNGKNGGGEVRVSLPRSCFMVE
ncbi:MAG: ActS/PrrB/RegB family redox-sensitive histidine kinase [Candidatus Puniceispirillum sp.]|jgi:two-component system, sensor histidine kinase RegB|nr:ActS/PrrB/RegB family redox-sensitive histidine kinase [Candidatus Puniceispirillum sp.]